MELEPCTWKARLKTIFKKNLYSINYICIQPIKYYKSFQQVFMKVTLEEFEYKKSFVINKFHIHWL